MADEKKIDINKSFNIGAERKLKLLRRARYLCESCGVYNPVLTIHHKMPKREVDKIPIEELKSNENLKVLCEACHRGIHRKDTMLNEVECTYILKMMKKYPDFFFAEINKELLVEKILRIRAMGRDKKQKVETFDDLEGSEI